MNSVQTQGQEVLVNKMVKDIEMLLSVKIKTEGITASYVRNGNTIEVMKNQEVVATISVDEELTIRFQRTEDTTPIIMSSFSVLNEWISMTI